MKVDFHQLELRYESLRVFDKGRIDRLVSSLSAQGQQTSVFVVQSETQANHYTLIDGYLRVVAMKRLAFDQVEAVCLPHSACEALLLRHHVSRSGNSSALEDGWFLQELMANHHFTHQDLADRLQKSVSWINRRLHMAKSLPAEVQQLVRSGTLCAHAAQKYFIPLARANRTQCVLIAQGLKGISVSSRQMESLYRAWRAGDAEVRQRIAQSPQLFLKSLSQAPKVEKNVARQLEPV